MKACSIRAQVRNKSGVKVDSNLHGGLLKIASRPIANGIYRKYISDENDIKNIPGIKLDSNGEATLPSLLQAVPEIQTAIINLDGINSVKEKIGLLDNDNIELAQKKISESLFKDSMYAKLDLKGDVNIDYDKEINKSRAERRAYDRDLGSRLKSILKKNGIGVESYNRLEGRLMAKGYVDFSVSTKAANGLVNMVKIAKGYEHEALSEEFAHLALEANMNSEMVIRLYDFIDKNNLEQAILDKQYLQYKAVYKNDRVSLIKEAMGKLVAHAINGLELGNLSNTSMAVAEQSMTKFENISISDIEQAKKLAMEKAGVIARAMITASDFKIDLDLIDRTQRLLYALPSVEEGILEVKDMYIDNVIKLYNIQKAELNFEDKMARKRAVREDIAELEKDIEAKLYMKVLMNVSNEMRRMLVEMNTVLKEKFVDKPDESTLQEKAAILNDARMKRFASEPILRKIRSQYAKDKDNMSESDRAEFESVMGIVIQAEEAIKNLSIQYENMSLDLLSVFVEPFLGEEFTNSFVNQSKHEIAVKILTEAEEDVSAATVLLDSLADSGSDLLSIVDQIIKEKVNKARLRTIEYKQRLEVLGRKMEQLGIDPEEFFEKDENGNKTGRYLSQYDYGAFKKEKDRVKAELKAKYDIDKDSDVSPELYKGYIRELGEWMESKMSHNNATGKSEPSSFPNRKYYSLPESHREILNEILSIKYELDRMLPEGIGYATAPMILRDPMERMTESGFLSTIKEGIKDTFTVRSTDTEYGVSVFSTDFEGRTYHTMPVYFKHLKPGESKNDISTDIVSTLTAYADMATKNSELSSIANSITLLRDYAEDNLNVKATKSVMGKIGFGIERKLNAYKAKSDRNIIKMLNDHIESKMFAIQKAKGIDINGVSVEKVLDFVSKMTAVNTLSFNALSGISNIMTGVNMMNIEAVAQEYFKAKDLLEADKIYTSELSGVVGDIGARQKTSKLSLFMEMFNVLQDFDVEIKDTQFKKKSRASRLMNSGSLLFLSSGGEHWMQTRTALALANGYILLDKNGNKHSLWDSLEVVPIDSENPSHGSKIKVKDGYTKEDGTEFTSNDIFRFTRKSAAINHRLHGIYNNEDKSTMQKYAVGRMAIMFRKWIVPSMNRRWSKRAFNRDLQSYTEGYYRTAFRFILGLREDIDGTRMDVMTKYNMLTNAEKANIKRALAEVSTFIVTLIALGLLYGGGDDDDDRPYASLLLEYTIRRFKSESAALVPWITMPQEALRVMKSPAASLNQWESIMNLLTVLPNPYNYEVIGGEDAVYKSGTYKGMSKGQAAIIKANMIPGAKAIMSTSNPTDMIKFYKGQ